MEKMGEEDVRPRGKFIVIEGGIGAGKDACIEYLKEKLENKNDVIFTDKPAWTVTTGDISIRQLEPLADIFLSCFVRAQYIGGMIKPIIQSGKHVICKQFENSIIAHQISGKERLYLYDISKQLSSIAKDGMEPDIIIFLDVIPDIGMRRKYKKLVASGSKEDIENFHKESLQFHQRVGDGLFKQYEERRRYKSKWRYIDTTNMTEKSVKKAVWDIVSKVLES